jgi:hypothetical protein
VALVQHHTATVQHGRQLDLEAHGHHTGGTALRTQRQITDVQQALAVGTTSGIAAGRTAAGIGHHQTARHKGGSGIERAEIIHQREIGQDDQAVVGDGDGIGQYLARRTQAIAVGIAHGFFHAHHRRLTGDGVVVLCIDIGFDDIGQGVRIGTAHGCSFVLAEPLGRGGEVGQRHIHPCIGIQRGRIGDEHVLARCNRGSLRQAGDG